MVNDGKTVIVTGAAGGIGKATCIRLAIAGWNVMAVDLDTEQLEWTSDVEKIHPFAADVTSELHNRAMVEEAASRFGGLKAMILNAGISGVGAIDELPFETFENIIAVNLYGAVHGIRAALPFLRRESGSAIAVTSSSMGLSADAENWAYAASKHALIGLVRSLSREIGWEGIRINSLCPGPVRDTGLTSGVERSAPHHYERMRANVPLQRWAEPDEMAAVLEFLISPSASYVNGAAIVADGGTINGTGLVPPKIST